MPTATWTAMQHIPWANFYLSACNYHPSKYKANGTWALNKLQQAEQSPTLIQKRWVGTGRWWTAHLIKTVGKDFLEEKQFVCARKCRQRFNIQTGTVSNCFLRKIVKKESQTATHKYTITHSLQTYSVLREMWNSVRKSLNHTKFIHLITEILNLEFAVTEYAIWHAQCEVVGSTVITMVNIQAPWKHLNSYQAARDHLCCSVKGTFTVTVYVATASFRLREA